MDIKKLNFAIDNGALSTISNEMDPMLIQEKYFISKSLSLFTPKVVGGIGAQKINLLDVENYWQDTACDMSTSGGTTFTQRTLEVAPISIRQSMCKTSFYDYWQTYFMKAGLDESLGELESQILDAYIKQISAKQEIAVWQAVDGGSNYYDKFDGLIEILSGSSCVDITAASAVTYTDIDDSVNLMTDAIPESISMEQPLKLYLSVKEFKALARKYNDTYKGFQERTFNSNYTMDSPLIPNLTIEAVGGLNGTSKMVLTTDDNIFVPVYDGPEGKIRLQYIVDEVTDLHWFKYDFIMGVQIGRPEYVVTNFLTA